MLDEEFTSDVHCSTVGSAVIDSFAWIEYFAGSKPGEIAAEYIESGKSITPTIAVDEQIAVKSRSNKRGKKKIAIILATARLHKVTGDEHFRDLEEAIMIKYGAS